MVINRISDFGMMIKFGIFDRDMASLLKLGGNSDRILVAASGIL